MSTPRTDALTDAVRYDSVEDLADALRTHACTLEEELARCREALASECESQAVALELPNGHSAWKLVSALRDLSKPTPEELP